EEVHAENVSAMMSALDDLKIAGVRPKPPLIAKQKDLSNLKELTQQQLGALAAELGRRGFFVFTDRQRTSYSIVCNEGEMHVSCDDGIVYHLRFGELLIGEGDAITAGGATEASATPKKDEKKPSGTENRYLFVSVRFDESLLPAAPAAPAEYKADPAKKPEEQKVEEEKAKAAKEEYERKKKEHDQKVADGKKRAEKLADRFAPWYYVISGDAFKKLRLDRPQLVKPKEKKDEAKKDGHEHKDGDGHTHDEKKPEPPKPPAPPKAEEPKKPEEPKSEAPKPDAPKPPEAPKPDEKKPEDAKKP
ncbi:MAG TPA: hypothetical protein VEJ18_06160, partial [Planctomycetota bacterium]|nr:hypothetical protein [Planctomycetota bacterium]